VRTCSARPLSPKYFRSVRLCDSPARAGIRGDAPRPVVGHPDVCWVAVACWQHHDGTTEWCLEYWDDQGEAGVDDKVSDEASAMAIAELRFGTRATDWRAGPQPWARPE
jgi:hypothetical protein